MNYFVPGSYNVQLVVYDGTVYDTSLMFNFITVDVLQVVWTSQNPTCGMANGTIDLSIIGGFPPYIYNWSNGSNTQNQTGLSAGSYDCFVTDGMGCVFSINVVLTNTTSFSLLESHTDAACANANGAIDLSPMGGTAPFIFQWSTGATTEDLNNIVAGIYSVTVIDANLCAISISITINNLNGPVIYPYINNEICGAGNGSISLYVSNGTVPYTYLWSNGGTDSTISSLSWGNYTVTVTDQLLCQGFASIAVYDSNLIAVSPLIQPINCGTHGNISVNATGGVLPYSYLWNTGETTASLQNVSLGNYTVTVSDAGTCVLVVPINAQFYFYTYLTSVIPNCSSNGSLTAGVYGGTPPFTYLWSNGDTNATAGNLPPGSYSVTVTDSSGCSTSGIQFLPTTCNNIIEGNVFNDLNSNCIQDSGEVAVQGIVITASNGFANYYAYSNNDGYYQIAISTTGNFNLSAYSFNLICGNLFSCTGSSNVFFGSVGDTSSNNNFGFVTTAANFDLLLHPGWHTANPGFDKDYWILYYNDAPISFNDTATVVFHYDTNLVYFDSIAPFPVHDAVAHTLTWEVYPVPSPGWNWNDRLHAFFHVPASLPVGYLLQSDFDIFPLSGDCNTSNNHLHYSESVTGSLDPNEKEVSPSGNITGADSVLTYTIHFQNTGNDTTHFVIVKDTLSQYLNPATVQNIASSDPYSDFNISGTGVLTWVFNPLFLPDSSTNEAASKAFVSFTVKTNGNLPVGTQIENTASIYFDYNTPVQTNTVSNSVISAVNNITDENVSVTAYPNPFSSSTSIVVNGVNGKFDFILNNVLGMKMTEMKNVNTSQFILKRSDLPTGIYFFSISTEGINMANGKLVID